MALNEAVKVGHDMAEPPDFAFPVVRTAALDKTGNRSCPDSKVLSVTAPTGYGKTVLLSELARQYRSRGTACFWLNLYDDDGDVERVLRVAESALGASCGGFADVRDVLHQGDVPVEDRIERLLRAVSRLPKPAVIFIDNLNFCQDERLAVLLDALTFRSAPGVYLVLSSISEPPLNLARAKIEGGLREIDFTDLQLDEHGIRALLGDKLAGRLESGAIDTIRDLTEGWPAAVRLLQIILADEDQPEKALEQFSGADKDVAALLKQQVLNCFDREFCRFFIEISLLGRFCVDLCRHATGNDHAAAFVTRLLDRNALIIPLDRKHTWYRLHGLLRDFLQSEATRTLPDERRQAILERAADWFERNGYWSDAMDTALAAGSNELASQIMERIAPLFVRDLGDLHQYIRWTESLMATDTVVGFEADYWYVWALVFRRRYEYARQQVERLSQRVDESGALHLGPQSLRDFRRRIEVIRVAISTYVDRLEDGFLRARDWLDDCENDEPFDVATCAVAATIYLSASCEFAVARQYVQSAQSAIAQSDSEYGKGWVAVSAAMVAMQEGEFPAALQQLDTALNRAKSALGERAGIVGTLSAVAAKCAVEMNHQDQATQLADAGLRQLKIHGVSDTAIVGLDAAVKLWDGKDDVSHLRDIAGAYPPRVATSLSCFLVRRYLRLERVEDAMQEARNIGLYERGPSGEFTPQGAEVERTRALLSLTEVDLAVSCGQFRHAEAVIEREQSLAKRQSRWADLVELALAEMAIQLCTHNPEPATRHFTRAITSAAKRRILRPFRERETMIAGLVNETKPHSWGFASEEERRFFGEVCHGLPMVNSSLLEQLEDLECETALLETPTARELELIKLVEAGLTNQQIADRVEVSVSTVKWHLYNLYTKLGVSSRSAALARARALNLLSR